MIFIGIVVMACSSIKTITGFDSFSEKVQNEQKKKKCGFYPDMTYKGREQLRDKFDFINYARDTVYILESINPESGSLYQSVWTHKNRLEYKVQESKVEIVPSPFIKRMYAMIESWDVLGIQKEEKEHGQLLGGSQMIGTRIILDNGKFTMECFSFKEFFDLKKDQ